MTIISTSFLHLSPFAILKASNLSILGQQHLPGETTTPPRPRRAPVASLNAGKADANAPPRQGQHQDLHHIGLRAHPFFLASSIEQRHCPRAGARGSRKGNLRERAVTWETNAEVKSFPVRGLPTLSPFPPIFVVLHSHFLRIFSPALLVLDVHITHGKPKPAGCSACNCTHHRKQGMQDPAPR